MPFLLWQHNFVRGRIYERFVAILMLFSRIFISAFSLESVIYVTFVSSFKSNFFAEYVHESLTKIHAFKVRLRGSLLREMSGAIG